MIPVEAGSMQSISRSYVYHRPHITNWHNLLQHSTPNSYSFGWEFNLLDYDTTCELSQALSCMCDIHGWNTAQ